MKFFLISLAFLAFTCGGSFAFPQADTSAINPILDNLFAEWLQKQQADQAAQVPAEGESAQIQNIPEPEPQAPTPEPPGPQPSPVQSFNPFMPQFAPNPFLPQAPPYSPFLDPAVNPMAYYPYLSPFGPFPLKIKKKKV